jgi:hypothetical protein
MYISSKDKKHLVYSHMTSTSSLIFVRIFCLLELKIQINEWKTMDKILKIQTIKVWSLHVWRWKYSGKHRIEFNQVTNNSLFCNSAKKSNHLINFWRLFVSIKLHPNLCSYLQEKLNIAKANFLKSDKLLSLKTDGYSSF